jgi:hypothetical protein
MTDNQQVMVSAVTRQKLAIEGRSRAGKVTGKLKIALDFMVWEKLTRSEAGKRAGLAEHSMRDAFRRPHVIAYYRAGCDALRENVTAKHIHNLDTIADNSKNDMARVASIKALAQMADEADTGRRGAVQTPGMQIVIIQAPGKPEPRVVGPQPFTIEQQPQRAPALPE